MPLALERDAADLVPCTRWLATASGWPYAEVMLHAQVCAIGFYRRAGFSERGERFEEAGICHREMLRKP